MNATRDMRLRAVPPQEVRPDDAVTRPQAAPAPRRRPIRALLPMACDGVGPSQTCLNLMDGAHLAGHQADVFAVRRRAARPSVPMHLALHGPLAALPYAHVEPAASRWIESRFLAAVRPGDVAYLWPSVSLETHRVLHERGIPIVLEGINTRMASAKRILDAAYEAFGAPPDHSITQERIDEEEAKHACASAIFAPNLNVERALLGSALDGRAIPASYGVDTSRASPERRHRDASEGLTFMFCGRAGVRKGVHHLLDAWAAMPGRHRLKLVGSIDAVLAERYRDLLASDRVEVVGFVKDVHPHFAQADVYVMPSLEEGDPLVTYEAALHGLPIIASPMGASRIGDVTGSMIVVDPSRPLGLARMMTELAESAERREELGRTAREVAMGFDWRDVGARRADLLQRTGLLTLAG